MEPDRSNRIFHDIPMGNYEYFFFPVRSVTKIIKYTLLVNYCSKYHVNIYLPSNGGGDMEEKRANAD